MTMQDTYTAAKNYVDAIRIIVTTTKTAQRITTLIAKEFVSIRGVIEHENILCRINESAVSFWYVSDQGSGKIKCPTTNKEYNTKEIPTNMTELHQHPERYVSIDELYKIGFHFEVFYKEVMDVVIDSLLSEMKQKIVAIKESAVTDLI